MLLVYAQAEAAAPDGALSQAEATEPESSGAAVRVEATEPEPAGAAAQAEPAEPVTTAVPEIAQAPARDEEMRAVVDATRAPEMPVAVDVPL